MMEGAPVAILRFQASGSDSFKVSLRTSDLSRFCIVSPSFWRRVWYRWRSDDQKPAGKLRVPNGRFARGTVELASYFGAKPDSPDSFGTTQAQACTNLNLPGRTSLR